MFQQLENVPDTIDKVLLLISLASTYYFDNNIKSKDIETKLLGRIAQAFERSLPILFEQHGIEAGDDAMLQVISQFNVQRYVKVIFILSNYLEGRGQFDLAAQLRKPLVDRHTYFCITDDSELEHLALVSFYDGDLAQGVSIMEFLVKKNPHITGYRINLLSFYLQDHRYQTVFLTTKDELLNNFSLPEEERAKVGAMAYN